MKSPLKLGTRRSLLAWAQSSWVAREVERLNPGIQVELVGIDTRGDKILDVSLQSVEGKEFFVAELDDALRSSRVDFTVHSMKDLSLDRPKEFILGAIPKRENPRDVILFGPGIEEKIKAGKIIRIGTSSPRRLENIPPFLEKALPRSGEKKPRLEFLEIRGNVNTRLSRVHEPEASAKHLDAVVLAFAGLIRLAIDQAGGAELKKLLQEVRWMALPLRECPAAPAQGALAIECRANDSETRAVLAKLHHAPTAQQVASERRLLADWGGGCHQKFGATAIPHAETGDLLFIRGKKPDQVFVEELRWKIPIGCAEPVKVPWDGSYWRSGKAVDLNPSVSIRPGAAIFVAHSRAVNSTLAKTLARARVWTSGVSSWFRLAEQGIWVEGCADTLGFEHILPTLQEKVLGLPAFSEWMVLTHESAQEGWPKCNVVATYRVPSSAGEAGEELRKANHIYWSSGSQFDELGKNAAAGVVHACGPGKTAAHLRAAGLKPLVFPSVEDWRIWLK